MGIVVDHCADETASLWIDSSPFRIFVRLGLEADVIARDAAVLFHFFHFGAESRDLGGAQVAAT